jgi:hypothetical protein
MKLRWRFGIIAGLFLAIFSLYPQFKMLYLRGAEWNGHYAYNDIDEVAYAGYLNALIDGRPRKNDPYTGRDDSPENPQPESLFSIQFIAPYTIAIPARVFGIGAPWAITISGAAAAFLTALAIFWLLGMITGDSLFAMAGTLVVLCGGALFAGEGAIGEVLGSGFSYPYFPGFRRYLPAMAFPPFFFLLGCIWKLIGAGSVESNQGSAVEVEPSKYTLPAAFFITAAVACFSYTVYSYFFIWTTAAAWLGLIGVLWLVFRPDGYRQSLKYYLIMGFGCLLLSLPYVYLLSNRARTTDDVQMLVHTRVPDLLRMPEIISFVVLAVIAASIMIGFFKLRDSRTLFAVSLALVQIAVFNQQAVTGESLQPIHYQVFIGNYVAGLAVIVTLGMLWQRAAGRESIVARLAIAGLAALAVVWGFVECHYTVRVLDEVNVIRDEALPVAERLAEIGKSGPDPRQTVVLDLGMAESDDLPTIAPQPVLWARHQHIFAGVTTQENKERYYQYLYYLGVSPRQLADGMKHGDFVSTIALFGWGRHTDRLNADFKPLTFGEIDAESQRFADYVRNFDASRPDIVRLSYLIAASDDSTNLENIDKWYIRGDGELYGRYVLYHLTLRP